MKHFFEELFRVTGLQYIQIFSKLRITFYNVYSFFQKTEQNILLT